MKTVTALVLGALLLGAGVLSARLVPGAVPAQDDGGMKGYVLGLIHRGETWSPEVTDEVMELQAGHMANIGRLVESGELVLAGPCGGDGDLRGIFIYDVTDLDAARALADSDPAVAAGRLRVDLYPWWGPAVLADLLDLERARVAAHAADDALHEHDGTHGDDEPHEHGGDDGHEHR